MHQRATEVRRGAWFGAYVEALLQRDVRELVHMEGLPAVPRLLQLLAARAGALRGRRRQRRARSLLSTRAGALLNYADIDGGQQDAMSAAPQ